jgi:hypothetical protein
VEDDMWCVRCKNDVVGCLCGDIEQRLASLSRRDPVIGPAARANLCLRLLLAKGAGKGPH